MPLNNRTRTSLRTLTGINFRYLLVMPPTFFMTLHNHRPIILCIDRYQLPTYRIASYLSQYNTVNAIRQKTIQNAKCRLLQNNFSGKPSYSVTKTMKFITFSYIYYTCTRYNSEYYVNNYSVIKLYCI